MATFKIESNDVKSNGNTVTSFKGLQLYKNNVWVCGVSRNIFDAPHNNMTFNIDTFEATKITNVVNRSFDVFCNEDVFNKLKQEILRLKEINDNIPLYTINDDSGLSEWV